MAFRKVFRDPFTSSTNGSFTGKSLEPHSTECSMMWGTPVESEGGVRKPMANTLFSSSLAISKTRAPLFLCRRRYPFDFKSARSSARTRSYASSSGSPHWLALPDSIDSNLLIVYLSSISCFFIFAAVNLIITSSEGLSKGQFLFFLQKPFSKLPRPLSSLPFFLPVAKQKNPGSCKEQQTDHRGIPVQIYEHGLPGRAQCSA